MKLVAAFHILFVIAAPAIAAIPPGYIAWDLDGNGDGALNNNTADMHGDLYVPSNYNPSVKYPIVTALHGMGGGGWDDRHIDSTFGNLSAHASSVGYLLFVPESPLNDSSQWSATNLNKVVTLLNRIGQTYNVDTNRLYVTGVSNGGGGVYSIVSQNPGKFAAAIPIAGVAPSGVSNSVLANTPMWLFHGDVDGSVNVSSSRNRVNAIRSTKGEAALTFPGPYTAGVQYWLGSDLASGAPYYTDNKAGYFKDPDGKLQYSEYRNWGHVIWPYVWNEEPLYTWMSAQSVPEPASIVMLSAVGLFTLPRRRRIA